MINVDTCKNTFGWTLQDRWRYISMQYFIAEYTLFNLIVVFFSADIDWMTAIQKENISHMLASMHLVLRQQDGQEKDAGEYCHITNTSYEKFVERSVSQQPMGVHLSKRSDFKYWMHWVMLIQTTFKSCN